MLINNFKLINQKNIIYKIFKFNFSDTNKFFTKKTPYTINNSKIIQNKLNKQNNQQQFINKEMSESHSKKPFVIKVNIKKN